MQEQTCRLQFAVSSTAHRRHNSPDRLMISVPTIDPRHGGPTCHVVVGSGQRSQHRRCSCNTRRFQAPFAALALRLVGSGEAQQTRADAQECSFRFGLAIGIVLCLDSSICGYEVCVCYVSFLTSQAFHVAQYTHVSALAAINKFQICLRTPRKLPPSAPGLSISRGLPWPGSCLTEPPKDLPVFLPLNDNSDMNVG
ncbi:hypothetical protein COCVIDRAFT_38065 [Bipolaris victoriae FI3]|uniref:Uncharacterized protein n=1 Tax=Bipolaris victoriae (strain FI3) TaxID=930091 RepID=W7EIX9_BIPV3|nr:hypothetical protein COCVIDRAFT_38065 [Bipolaris victoriae FI3]